MKKNRAVKENTPLEPKPKEVVKIEISPELEDRFKNFDSTSAEFEPEENENTFSEGEKRENAPHVNEPRIPTAEEQLKIKMFLGFCSFLLVGFNTFLLNFLRKSSVPFDKMILTDDELLQFTPYVSGEQMLNFLNKIPAWLIGIAHFEYLMFSKHSLHVQDYKKVETKPTKKK